METAESGTIRKVPPGLPSEPASTPLAGRGLMTTVIDGSRYPFQVLRTAYLGFSSLYWEGRRGRELVRRVLLQQIYFTAVQALPLALFAAVGVGSLVMIQAGIQLPTVGVRDIEAITGWVLFRELCPLIVALIVIARSATAIIVEVGNMRVNGELRSLEILGVNLDLVVALPRLVGMLLSVPLLTVVFCAAAFWGGYWVGGLSGLLATNFQIDRLAEAIDANLLRNLIARVSLFGLLIGSVAVHHGFRVKVAATEVPQQATRGVVGALTLCFLVNFVLSVVFY